MTISHSQATPRHLVKVESNELLLGMFVSELDCLWTDTPFPVDGFHLRKVEDIKSLQNFCKIVTIDTTRGALPQRRRKEQLTILSSARKAAPEAASFKVSRDTYPVSHTIKQQIDKAYNYYKILQAEFSRATTTARKGEQVNPADFEKSILGLIDVVIANPQTLIWILNTDPSEFHQGSYCVRAAIWSAILARQIGMSIDEIEILFLGTLLADIGMCALPQRLLDKRGPYRKKEFLAYKKHVVLGVKYLSQIDDLDDRVISIVRSHHERHDGLGFPRGLRGKQIPAFARFANLAYGFERLLSSLDNSRQNSPAKAMGRLYKQRELKFPDQLVVEFMHILSAYPVGSIVELSSGELALVLEQNTEERLSPKIGLITDSNRVTLRSPKTIDLDEDERTISRSLGSQSLNFDAKDYTFSFFGKRLGFGKLGIRF